MWHNGVWCDTVMVVCGGVAVTAEVHLRLD